MWQGGCSCRALVWEGGTRACVGGAAGLPRHATRGGWVPGCLQPSAPASRLSPAPPRHLPPPCRRLPLRPSHQVPVQARGVPGGWAGGWVGAWVVPLCMGGAPGANRHMPALRLHHTFLHTLPLLRHSTHTPRPPSPSPTYAHSLAHPSVPPPSRPHTTTPAAPHRQAGRRPGVCAEDRRQDGTRELQELRRGGLWGWDGIGWPAGSPRRQASAGQCKPAASDLLLPSHRRVWAAAATNPALPRPAGAG